MWKLELGLLKGRQRKMMIINRFILYISIIHILQLLSILYIYIYILISLVANIYIYIYICRSVFPGSPAKEAGFQVGDLLTEELFMEEFCRQRNKTQIQVNLLVVFIIYIYILYIHCIACNICMSVYRFWRRL